MEHAVIIVLLTLLTVSAVMVAVGRDLFAAVLLLGIYSLLSAGVFVALDAPDVAFTEAAVGAGFSTVLLLAAVAATAHFRTYTPQHNLSAIVLTAAVGCLMLYSVADMPAFADPDAPAHRHVAEYYLRNTPNEIGVPNAVTAVLASYRGFDTLGELIVIFTAGIGAAGVFAATRRRRRNQAQTQASAVGSD